MRVTFTFDEHDPQEQAIMRRLQVLARERTRHSGSPFPFSCLEQGVRAAFYGLEWVVRRLVCAIVR